MTYIDRFSKFVLSLSPSPQIFPLFRNTSSTFFHITPASASFLEHYIPPPFCSKTRQNSCLTPFLKYLPWNLHCISLFLYDFITVLIFSIKVLMDLKRYQGCLQKEKVMKVREMRSGELWIMRKNVCDIRNISALPSWNILLLLVLCLQLHTTV